jgi:hypothetical protein
MMFAQLDRRLSILPLALLAVLSGCVSGSSGSVPGTANVGIPAPSLGVVGQPNKKGGKGGCGSAQTKGASNGGVVSTAQLYGFDLKVYQRLSSGGLKLVCILMQGVQDPNGTMATVNGWWYVANGGGENVLVYRFKKGLPHGPVSTLADYNEYATNVAVNPNRNLVAVSNLNSISNTGGSLSIYVHRQAVPVRVLTYGSSKVYGAGVALSHKGDCYWAFNTGGSSSGPGSIVEFKKCIGSGRLIVSGIPLVGGLVFDQSDDLYYVNSVSSSGSPAGIYKCKKTSSCKPWSIKYFVQPTNMNFDYKGKDLWVVDPGADLIDEVNSSGTIIRQDPPEGSDLPYGIAPEPGA